MPEQPGVVFVHGLFGALDEPDAAAMLPATTWSAPELLGYGRLVGSTVTVEGQVAELRERIHEVHGSAPVHLVCHSIGAVWAMQYAAESPELVASVVNVEGNFSLADAFWSQAISELTPDAARERISAVLESPGAWLVSADIVPTPALIAKARRALRFQTWETVWTSARAVVEFTGDPGYELMLRRVFDAVPVHLLAGERSRDTWNVPAWAIQAAASVTIQPNVGHLMPLERPQEFGRELARILS